MEKKTMRTIPALVLHLAEITGLPESTIGNIARRIREGGLLTQAGRGRGAALAASSDAATLCLVATATDKSVHAAIVADALCDLRLVEEGHPYYEYYYEEVKGPNGDAPFGGLIIKARDPIGALSEIIDALRDENPPSTEFRFEVVQGGSLVHIYAGEDSWSFCRVRETKAIRRFDEVLDSVGRSRNPRASALQRHGSMDAWGLKSVADWLAGRIE